RLFCQGDDKRPPAIPQTSTPQPFCGYPRPGAAKRVGWRRFFSAGGVRGMSSQPLRRLSKPVPGPAGKPRPASTCTVLLPTMELHIPSSIFTLDGFRAWATSDDSPDHAKITFVDQQVIIDMSGEEIQACTLVKTAVVGVVFSLVQKRDLGLLSIDSALLSNE